MRGVASVTHRIEAVRTPTVPTENVVKEGGQFALIRGRTRVGKPSEECLAGFVTSDMVVHSKM